MAPYLQAGYTTVKVDILAASGTAKVTQLRDSKGKEPTFTITNQSDPTKQMEASVRFCDRKGRNNDGLASLLVSLGLGFLKTDQQYAALEAQVVKLKAQVVELKAQVKQLQGGQKRKRDESEESDEPPKKKRKAILCGQATKAGGHCKTRVTKQGDHCYRHKKK